MEPSAAKPMHRVMDTFNIIPNVSMKMKLFVLRWTPFFWLMAGAVNRRNRLSASRSQAGRVHHKNRSTSLRYSRFMRSHFCDPDKPLHDGCDLRPGGVAWRRKVRRLRPRLYRFEAQRPLSRLRNPEHFRVAELAQSPIPLVLKARFPG